MNPIGKSWRIEDRKERKISIQRKTESIKQVSRSEEETRTRKKRGGGIKLFAN